MTKHDPTVGRADPHYVRPLAAGAIAGGRLADAGPDDPPFRWAGTAPLTLDEVVFQALGAAAACTEDRTLAEVGAALVAAVTDLYRPVVDAAASAAGVMRHVVTLLEGADEVNGKPVDGVLADARQAYDRAAAVSRQAQEAADTARNVARPVPRPERPVA